jgi:hypothetical protein
MLATYIVGLAVGSPIAHTTVVRNSPTRAWERAAARRLAIRHRLASLHFNAPEPARPCDLSKKHSAARGYSSLLIAAEERIGFSLSGPTSRSPSQKRRGNRRLSEGPQAQFPSRVPGSVVRHSLLTLVNTAYLSFMHVQAQPYTSLKCQPPDMHSRTRASDHVRSRSLGRVRLAGEFLSKRPEIFELRNELKNGTHFQAQNWCYSRSFTPISGEDRLPALGDIYRARFTRRKTIKYPENVSIGQPTPPRFLPIASTRWSKHRSMPTIR